MVKKSSLISVIMVTYKEVPELVTGLDAVFKSIPNSRKSQVEVIVVDNNKDSHLKPKLAKRFPKVKYFNTGDNIGFGPANNFGVQRAKGDFLFFLNPDTELQSGALFELRQFLVKHRRAAIVAPTLFDMQGKPYQDQGSAKLTPLTALAAHSVLHRIWPNNSIAQGYWLRDRNLNKPQSVEVVPGTAFMIRKSVFEAVGGFDEQFFIYFEESDLCRRLLALGGQAWILPSAKAKHLWHAATKSNLYKTIYRQSRFKYFKKYYGSLLATGVEFFLTLGKKEILQGLVGVLVALLLLSLIYGRK